MSQFPNAEAIETRFDHSSQWAIASYIVLTIASVFLIGVLCQVVMQTTSYEKMFKEMGMPLPVLTQFCMSPYLPPAIVALGVLGVLNVVLVWNAKVRLVLATTHLLLVLVTREAFVMAMYLPLMELMRKMGGQR